MEIKYAVIKTASRRNQQNRIIFEGTKKECKEHFTKLVQTDKENDYFVGQYMVGMLNRVVVSSKKYSENELSGLQNFPTDDKPEIEDNVADESTLDILKEKYR